MKYKPNNKTNLIGCFSCKVPECDIGANNREIPYNQPWLASAIPYSNGKFDQCHRYAPVNQNKLTDTFQCDSNLFNTSQIIPCSEYIYASDEKNVQTEVNSFIDHVFNSSSNLQFNFSLISIAWIATN